MKHLIPMTDFVLNQAGWYESKIRISEHEFAQRVLKYANFLKQSLELSMFVPLDEQGAILEEPKREDYFDVGFNFKFNEKYFDEEIYPTYQKANKKVLFEGWECKMFRSYENEKNYILSTKKEDRIVIFPNLYKFGSKGDFINTIQDICYMKPKLTQTAIDQIFN